MQQYKLAALALENLNFICYITDLTTYDLLFVSKPTGGDLSKLLKGDFKSKKCYTHLRLNETPCSHCRNSSLEFGKRIRNNIYDEVSRKQFIQIDTLIEIDNKPAKLAIIYDPTLDGEDIESITQKLSLEETLISCIQTLIEDTKTDNAIQTLLNIVASYYGSKRAYVFEVNYKEHSICKIHEWQSEHIQASQIAVHKKFPLKQFLPLLDIFSKHGELAFKAVDKELEPDSIIYNFLQSINVNSILVVPFVVDGKITYFMGTDAPTKNTHQLSLLHSVILFVVDKIKKQKAYNHLIHLSYSDQLTSIWNRNKYSQRIEELEKQNPETLGYVHISLNGLKKINELYGEAYGDDLLKQTANILRQFLGDDLFRFGGNEFIALHPNTSPHEFDQVLNSLRQELKKYSEISLSIGSIYQYKKIDLRKGLEQAYDIMFAEKQKYYKEQNNETIQTRPNAMQIILEELRAGNFTVYLQPKVNLLTEEISSAEALVRKFDKDGKIIPPDNFIPIYENEGTIRHVDFFVLEEVCKLLHRLIKEDKALKISVNFSRVTFISPNLLEEIIETCAKYEVPHEYIKIEITESIDKMDFEFFDKKLKKIKNAGFEISLDDFGAKHSNLLMLTMTEFSEVKIDKGLIDYITQSAQNRALVKNILKMISELGTSICVAEGIETKEQRDMILDFGCTHGQGYLFYRPMPIEEFLLIYEINRTRDKLKNAMQQDFSLNFTLSYNEMSAIIDAMPFCVTLLNDKNDMLTCNQCVVDTFGLKSKEEFLSKLFDLSPEFQPNGAKSSQLAAKYIQKAYDFGHLKFPWVHRTKQGKEFATEVTLKKLTVKGSEETPLLAGFIRELTPEIDDKNTFEWSESYGFHNEVSERALITTLLEISSSLLWTFNYKTNQMMFFGEGHEELGLPRGKFKFPEEFMKGNYIYEEDMEEFLRSCDNLTKGEHSPTELRFNVPNKEPRYFRLTYKIIKDYEGNPLTAIGKVLDINDQKTPSHLSQIDHLTKCYNDITAKMLMEECIKNNQNSTHALFRLDIDNLKYINQNLGHPFGDSILVDLVQDLQASFRDGDIIGRVGCDDFVVFLKNAPNTHIIMDKKDIIEKLLIRDYSTTNHNFSVYGSMGMALYPQHGKTLDELLEFAEACVKKEKKSKLISH